MRRASDEAFHAFLHGLPGDQRVLVRSLRDLVLRTVPSVVESSLWGALSYHRPEVGGRVKGAVCLIDVKAGQIRLAFIHGARLPDPARRLCGGGKSKRFVPVASRDDLAQPELADLLRAAAALTWK